MYNDIKRLIKQPNKNIGGHPMKRKDYLVSDLLSQATKKAIDKRCTNLPKAKEVNDIHELINVINTTDKRNMTAIQFEGISNKTLGEYTDINAISEGNTLYITDKTKTQSPLTMEINNIRAYHENHLSISIYTRDNQIIVLRHTA